VEGGGMSRGLVPAAAVPNRARRAVGWWILAALPAGAALAVVALLQRPLLVGLAGAAVVGSFVVARGARQWGAAGIWLVLTVLAVLAGEMSSISFGGQHGRLLWADLVLGAGVGWALVRRSFVVEIPRAPFLDRLWPFLAWGALGALLARDPVSSASELKEWFAAVAVGVAAASYATDARRARLLLGAVAVCGALMGLLMLHVAFTARLGPLYAIVMKQVDLAWGRTNYLAGILILAVPIALGLIGSARSPIARAAWSLVLAGAATGLLLSTSKGGIAALVVALAVSYAIGRQASRAPRLILLAVTATAVALYVAGPLQEVFRYRLQQSAIDYSVGERTMLYQLGWDAFLRNPVFGIGPDNFPGLANRLRGVDTVPHNFELGYLAESGLPGFILIATWAIAMGLTAWRARRDARHPRDRSLALGLWAAFVGFAVHNQVESTICGQQYKMLLMLVAAATWRLGLEWGTSGSRS
jgi:O-antigen ligase